MSNRMRGEVSLKLGETEYLLRPTMEAMQQIEDLTGAGIMVLAKRFIAQDYGVRDIRNVLVPAIKAGGGKVPDDLAVQMREAGIITLGSLCAKFLAEALSGGDEKNAEAPAEAPPT